MPNGVDASATSFPFPSPGKFALVALTEAAVSLRTALQLTSNCWAFPSLPFDLDANWKKWLGELRCRELKDSNLVIVFAAPSLQPFLLSSEDENLEERVRTFLGALLVIKAPALSRINMLSGVTNKGRYTLRSVANLPWYFCREGQRETVRKGDLLLAGKVFEGIELLYAEQTEFRLLGKGYEAFKRGMHDGRNDLRLHQFTRSLEALILPEIGRTTRMFSHRCQTFCEPGDGTVLMLKEIYDIRSCVEHHREPTDLFPGKRQFEVYKILDDRAHQVEDLARLTYRCILSNKCLMNFFRTKDLTKQFWALPESERRSYFTKASA